MKKIVVWYNPNKDIYYYRIVRGIFYERYDYKVGAINNYDHIIVCVIPVYSIDVIKRKPPSKPKHYFINKCSSFLNL